MASNTTTTTGSTAGLDIDWDNLPAIPVDCEKCGVAFDAVEDGHGWRGTVCQDLFGGDMPANVPAAADTTPAVEEEKKKNCGRCNRVFRVTPNTNGVDCSWCCNKWAHNGHDIFAPHGRQMSSQAAEYLHQYHLRLAMPAVAPIATMRRNTFSAAPIFSAPHATTAPMPRKRAAESAKEQISQQNEPTAKRSKTSQQQQATTMPTEHGEMLPTATRQTTPPGEYGTGFRNMLQAAINQMDDKSTR